MNDEISKIFNSIDLHKQVKKNHHGPERYKKQGKKIKRALFYKRGERPTDKAPKGFIKRTKKISEDAALRKLFGL